MLAWAFAVGVGLEIIWKYQNAPGAAVAGPAAWPGSSLISPQPGRATLVMFVHPRCSCSRASLVELSQIMEREQGRVSAWVLFMRPQGTEENWERTATWQTAQRIPGVTVLTDKEGVEAVRFGAATSGHVVLYDSQGRFVFGGGITGSRGHVGDNAGLRRVVSLLDGGTVDRPDHPVFGCAFHDLNAKQTDS